MESNAQASLMSQAEKAKQFRHLHNRPGAFVMPNPWDAGSARLLASMNFEALATTSTGFAHSMGKQDGRVSRDQVMAHCKSIVYATDLPVSGDLENGYGDAPEQVAETIKLAAQTGLVGGSIEDYTMRPDNPIYAFNHAVERIQAANEARRGLDHDFVLTARCENYVWGKYDIDDTIKRLTAFETAGADVLYAPGLQDLDTIKAICNSLTKPVNVVIEMKNTGLTIDDLVRAGARRISIGSVLFLSAYGRLVNAAAQIKSSGRFDFADDAIAFSELERIFAHYNGDD